MKRKGLVWLGSLSVALTTLVGIYTSLEYFNINLPKPVWAGDLKQVQDHVIELDLYVTEQQLDSTTLRLYQNLREQRTYEQTNQSTPDFLLQEQTTLESKKRKLENRMDQLLKN